MNQETVKKSSVLIIVLVLMVMIQPVYAIPGNYHGDDQGNNGVDPSLTSGNDGPHSDQNEEPVGDGIEYQQGTNNTSLVNATNQDENMDSSQQGQNGENTYSKKQYRYQKGKQDLDGDFIEDHQERYQHRNMMMTCNKNQTRIRSEWKQENNTDVFELLFTLEPCPTIHFHYMPEANSSHKEMDFDISFLRLIEFLDHDKNGRYDDVDEIISTYDLTNTTYDDINYSQIISDDNETISIAKTNTIDDKFSLVLYVTGNFSYLQDRILTPSEVKMDFVIDNYEFTQSTSYIALEVELNSIDTVEIESETFDEKQGFSQQEHELNISSISNHCFFSWLEYALIDNETREVNVSVYTTSSQTIINETKELSKTTSVYFAYPQGDHILHDPKIGVMSLSYQAYASSLIQELTEEVSMMLFLVICVTAAVLFIGSIYIRKRI